MYLSKLLIVFLIILNFLFTAQHAFALASSNIPLDSPVYLYLEKLAGFGLIDSDVKGLRPYSRSEAARLYLEAEGNLARTSEASSFITDIMQRLEELLPREISLRREPDRAPLFDYELVSASKVRLVYLDGKPRDYNRTSWDPAHQSAFGFIGGDLRPLGGGGPVVTTGTEGTPLLENNEGVVYHRGSNADIRWAMQGFVSDKVSLLVEPRLLLTEEDTNLGLQKGYLKIGGGGVELEVGRDANWFGPGYRGTTTLTNNAKNFDMVKLSSPEPLAVDWVRRWVGDVKYSLFVSRFDETDAGTPDYRRPWMVGFKLAVKPKDWFEIGANFVRQTGGPGFTGSPDTLLGGGDNDHSNTIAGLDLRFRIPGLRNTEVYGEFSGEDNAGGVWPMVESYVAGFYIPRLTDSGRDDLRFEYFRGSVMLYGDWQFPAGYVYHGMTPGHSQGTAAEEFFLRYSHWFFARHNLALEYFHTERGHVGKIAGQSTEYKDAGRIFWTMPVYSDIDMNLMYGWEHINNLNLVGGVSRNNQLLKVDVSYKY